MAYDQHLADRITQQLIDKNISFDEKKMFGGLCFMVDNKMCVGIIKNELMIRIDPDLEDEVVNRTGYRPMDFTGRPMKGYFNVAPEGMDTSEELSYWIDLCLEFNPKANSSKKKKR